jgi:hypothetical protein
MGEMQKFSKVTFISVGKRLGFRISLICNKGSLEIFEVRP